MTTKIENKAGGSDWTPVRERLLLLTLATIQFTTILDFLIIMPLGPQYKRVFSIDERQFGFIVASYGIAAGIAGLAAGFFLDRFDRKKALLWLYAGFGLGTLFCAMAPSYHLLVAARFFAGAFGGVVGAVILAIIGDVIPMARRGAAMGMVMSAFSISSIGGVPLGLIVATKYGWHVPFYAIAVLSVIVLVVTAYVTPSLRIHMQQGHGEHSFARTVAVMMHPDHQKAYLFMSALTFTGFIIFPYIAPYMVANVGLTEGQLPWIYFCGGLVTFFSMNWVGRWADRAGKLKVFTLMSLSTAVPILLVTNLPKVPLFIAVGASTLLMVCMSGRMVPAMALMTGAVEAKDRGGFMSINSAVQQFSVGLTSLLGGLILGQSGTGKMTNFRISGLLSLACAYGCIYLARFLKMPAPQSKTVSEPVVMEG